MYFQSNGKKIEEKPQIITANLYDSPEFALGLVADICTEKEDVEIDGYFDAYKQSRKELLNKIIELDDKLSKEDDLSKTFWDSLINPLDDNLLTLYWDCFNAVQNTSSSKLKIAVAGGYSAGKSSLLNALTAIGDKLPTGIEPVSIVNTQLNCKKRKSPDEKLAIRGINLADKYVKLDENVLSCIQHSGKNKIALASVLKSIILDIPTPEYLDGITFVDTPGYNNSAEKNKENNATDSETARKGIESSDLVFWCIDIETGAISAKDFEIICHINKPTCIFFTKMDKKAEVERQRIINLAARQAKERLKDNFIGIAGISCVKGEIKFYSPHFQTPQGIIWDVSQKYGKKSLSDDFSTRLNDEFIKTIEWVDRCIDTNVSDRNAIIENRNILEKEKAKLVKLRKEHIPNQGVFNSIDMESVALLIKAVVNDGNPKLRVFRDFLVGSASWDDLKSMGGYKEVFDNKSSINRLKTYCQSPRVDNVTKDMLASLWNLVDIRNDDFNKFWNSLIVFVKTWHEQKNKNEINNEDNLLANLIDDKINELANRIERYYNDVDTISSDIKVYEEIKGVLCFYQRTLSNNLSTAYDNSKQKILNHLNELKSPKEKDYTSVKNDVFAAINNDDYKAFVKCFEEGINMQTARYNGYSPLTYAVSQGNNRMVQFFIDHNAKLATKDSNGYNALETAVIFHYQDICEMIMKTDEGKSLVYKCKDFDELYELNTFKNYIKTKLI